MILLFVRLVIWRERRDSSLKKALGFVSADIRKEYLGKVFLYVLPGIAAVVTGAAMIYLPAGIIAGGLGLIALAIILIKGSGPDRS